MIVKDNKDSPMDSETRDLKSAYAPLFDRGAGEQGHYTALSQPLPMDGVQAQSPFLLYRTGRERATRRFCRAIAVSLIIWVFLTLFVKSILHLHLVHRHPWHRGPASDYPEFDKGEALQCAQLPDWTSSTSPFNEQLVMSRDRLPPYHSSTSFSLPADADLLYFLSRGSLSEGIARVTLASDSTAREETVEVGVTAWYWTTEALERASVCALEKHENGDQYGVGIFTPQGWPGRSWRDRLYFDVEIRLPSRTYKAFEMDYENFSLELHGKLKFGNASLKTTNGRVFAENLETNEGSVKSANAPIGGTYNVTSRLELVTSNSPIDVEVDMYSENSQVTSLLLKTSNGRIHSNLYLYGPPTSSSFAVQSRTANSPNLVRVVTQPHSSPLTLDVRSANSPVVAALHPAFEGPFALRTSYINTPILRTGDSDIEDPSGEGRHRSVEISKRIASVLEGKVWWGDWARKDKGWVQLATSNSPVELDLTGSREL